MNLERIVSGGQSGVGNAAGGGGKAAPGAVRPAVGKPETEAAVVPVAERRAVKAQLATVTVVMEPATKDKEPSATDTAARDTAPAAAAVPDGTEGCDMARGP